jgi:eukaryotic-like serine/threonine-protein kinase
MVACPAENTWLRYVGGGIEPTSAEAIEQHLDTCASCRFMFVNLAKGSAANEATDPTAPALDGTDPTMPAKLARFELTTASELVRGAVIDRYVVLGTLGRGGMGVVYKAFDPELDRPIALKLVAVNGFGSDADESRARLLREAKTLAQLSHPNVVGVHDVGSHEGDVFVAMEFVAGQTLRKWLDGTRTPREILAVFRAAGAGLGAAHKLGIVHRDFKPENVMVGDDGRVRVLDFGLAQPGERATTRPSLPSIKSADSIDLTRAGAIMGTPAYMAPEQDLGDEVDGRSDQFSFCAALYEALFKQRAFAGTSYTEIATNRVAGEVRPVPSVRGVSSRVRRALLRGLRVAPAQRHGSMDALLGELGAQRMRVKLAIAALALTSLGAGGWATYVAMHAAPSTDELCKTSAGEVERVWTPKRRADLIKSVDAFDAHDTAIYVADTVDHYTADWSARRTALCKLMVDGNHETNRDDLTSSRMQCLRRRLNTLDATVSVLIHAPTKDIVSRAKMLIDDLDPLAECDGTDTTPIVNEGARERWRPLIKDLVEAHSALGNGKFDDAERLANEIIKRAEEMGEPEPRAAALLILGQTYARNGGPAERAKAKLLEGVRAGTIAHEDGMVADAWLEIIGLAFTDRTMLKDLDSAIFGAEIAALRLSATDDRLSQLTYKIGTAQLLRGEMTEALPKLEKARVEYAKRADRFPYEIAAVDNSMGVAHLYLGEWKEAREAFDRSIETWSKLAFLHPNLPTAVGWLGEMAAIQHDFTGAEPHYKRELADFEKLGKAGASSTAKAQFKLGFSYARSGRCSEAKPLLDAARESALERDGKLSALAAFTYVAEAHCLLEAHKPQQALDVLDGTLEIATRAPATLLQVAYTKFALARALVAAGKGKRRAVALADEARDDFARFPGARADRDIVEAWLQAQR